METKVLVAYASSHGSAQEIAEVIAGCLRERGLAVDIQPARNVRTLTGYRAVVLGAAIYMGHLHKGMLRFLSRFREALAGGLPVAIFAGGPMGSGDEAEWQAVRKQVDQELAKIGWLQPIAVEIVGGRFDPARLRFPWTLLPALRRTPASDRRNWPPIRVWAIGLTETFQPALAR